MKKSIVIFAFALMAISLPLLSRAQNDSATRTDGSAVFEARVIAILEEREAEGMNGTAAIQQNLKLVGLDGPWKDNEIVSEGISDTVVAAANAYREGDRVIVHADTMPDGATTFYVTDIVRRGHLYFLAALFALVILVIGRTKGLRSLLGLIASFVVIFTFILPNILSGGNPLVTALLGASAMLAVIIYLSEGWNKASHLAVASVAVSLLITLLLSVLFTGLTRLTGFANEETFFLMGLGSIVDFKGLLLAGMLIGAIGILDDVIVGQIEAVKQIIEANPELPPRRVFAMAYRIGDAHLGAMVNTLFLTYAGVSLPLLLLFTVKQEPFLSFNQVINNEMIATEAVRALVGGIGVALSMPISTFFGARFLKPRRRIS